MKINIFALGAIAVMALTGCGASPSASSTTNTSSSAATSSTKLDPKMYTAGLAIYNKVSHAIKQRNDPTMFDSVLNSVTSLGQSAPAGSPTSIVYQDAATCVALDDSIMGDGITTSEVVKLNQSLATLKSDLNKYNPSK